MRKDSLKGIFSHYPASYPFSIFLSEIWGAYLMFVQLKKEERLANPSEDEKERDIIKRYGMRGHGTYSALFDPKDYEELVRQLDELSELRVTTWSSDSKDDEPSPNSIRNIHKTYRFKEGQTPTRAMIEWIKSKRDASARLTKAGKTRTSGSIVGERDGKSFTILFEHNLEDYLEFEHNKIGQINTNDLANNPCLKKMIAVVRDQITFSPESDIQER